MRFNDELRRRYPKQGTLFDDWEAFFADYESRFTLRLVSQDRRPRRLLGHRCAHLLLTSLSRIRFLTATVIHCANGGLAPGMFLAARAHWEMTGLVAHLLIALRKFYVGEMAETELDATVARLALGRRWEIPENAALDMTAINAITLVSSAGKLLGDKGLEDHVERAYGFLSEFCHPNLFGRLAGVTLSEDLNVVDFDPGFVLPEVDLGVCLSHAAVSHKLFLYAYDQCFDLLHEHEEMPTLEGQSGNGDRAVRV
jgi:hypothetical protein